MSKGDNLIGKKRTYKQIEFRSGLECKFAYLLDSLKIKWEYEPKRFLLSTGMFYVPDFYLPEHKMWIETKGVIEEHNKEISKTFVMDNKQHLILISSEENFYYGNEYEHAVYEDKDILIGLCNECKAYFFSSNYGDYRCKKCGVHDGDHVFHHCPSNLLSYFKEVINGSIQKI